MSEVYQQEPPTSGKVILKTNYGDIEIELWTNETPRACRNFIQLCLEGYYDNTIFHRIIPGFMVQGGDPTGTGEGGQSIYGAPFMDEYHSRLKFSHRGIVAMANQGTTNTNQSQFFMTVDQCSWLNRKHTIFGKVEGQTIFNLIRISELETDKLNDRPICDPIPLIQRVEVTVNPFDDIVPRNISIKNKYQSTQQNKIQAQEQQQIQTIKNQNLLSFNDEGEEDEEIQQPSSLPKNQFKKIKIKSSHDVLQNDPSLSKTEAVSKSKIEEVKKRKQELDSSKQQLIEKISKDKINSNNKDQNQRASVEETALALQEQLKGGDKRKKLDIDKEIEKMRKRERSRSRSLEKDPKKRAIQRAAQRRGVRKFATNYNKGNNNDDSQSESDYSDDIEDKYLTETQKQALQKTREEYNNLKADLLQFKKTKIGTLLDEQNINVQARVSALDLQRQKYINQMRNTKHRENETLARLGEFSQKIRSSKDDDKNNWMQNKLKFQIDSQKAYDVNKAVSYQEQQKQHFENFLSGGNINKKYQQSYTNVKKPDLGDDVIQGMNMEDFISMNELLELTKKKQENHSDNLEQQTNQSNQ